MITPTEWSHRRKGGDRSTRVAYLDDEVLKGAFYVEANWLIQASDTGTEAHDHDFDEVIGFFGSNPEDPYDLCGEVEFWLGDEKHHLTKSCVIFVPKGLKHCPMIFKRVDRPILNFATGPGKMYVGEKR